MAERRRGRGDGSVFQRARKYLQRPCHDGYGPLYWAVTGGTADGSAGGVMAWCYDEEDAHEALAALEATGDFRGLTVENLSPTHA